MPARKEERKTNVLELERDVILRARTGDRAAFGEIVYFYQKRIFSIGYGYFMNREDAMEIVQETFLKAYQGIKHLRDADKLSSWLYTIANNLCRDHYSKKKRRDWKEVEMNESHAEFIGKESIIKNDLVSNETADYLKRSIMKLPHKQKVIVIMRHFQELKYKEIAEILGRTVGTIKRLHFEAIKKLRKNLEENSE